MWDTGYHFVDWSDGVLTATRQDTNVNGLHSRISRRQVIAPRTDLRDALRNSLTLHPVPTDLRGNGDGWGMQVLCEAERSQRLCVGLSPRHVIVALHRIILNAETPRTRRNAEQ